MASNRLIFIMTMDASLGNSTLTKCDVCHKDRE